MEECTSTWSALFLLLTCLGTRPGFPHLIQTLWRSPSSPATHKHQLCELLCAVLVLMRHEEWRCASCCPKVVHDAILTELLYQQELDLQQAAAWTPGALRVPACNVNLGCDKRLTSHQADLILNAIPFTVLPSLRLQYRLSKCAIRVTALAGCGKTTALLAFAKAHPQLSILYTSFNKEAQLHAEKLFPKANVKCATTHALAGDKRNCLFPENSGNGGNWGRGRKGGSNKRSYEDSCARHGKKKELWMPSSKELTDVLTAHLDRGKRCHVRVVGVVKKMLEKFLTTMDEHITEKYLPDKLPPFTNWRPDYVDLANHVYRKMIDPRDTLCAPHNAYLKLYCLEKPVLTNKQGRPFDCILIDEAQDLNEMTVHLFMSQPGVKIFVGDAYQHVYSFNFCENILQQDARVQWSQDFQLNCTFRTGPEVGWVANRVLMASLGATQPLLALKGRGGDQGCCVYVPNRQEDAQQPTQSQPQSEPQSQPQSQSQPQCQSQSQAHPQFQSQFQSQSQAHSQSQSQSQSQFLSPMRRRCQLSSSSCTFKLFRYRRGRAEQQPPGWPDELPTHEGTVLLPTDACGRRPQLVVICRTNAGALLTAAKLACTQCTLSMSVEYHKVFPKVEALHTFRAGGPPTHFALQQYQDYWQFREAMKSGLDMDWKQAHDFLEMAGGDVHRFMRQIRERTCGTQGYNPHSEFHLTTTHQAKGQEWDYVQLGEDFVTDVDRMEQPPGPAATSGSRAASAASTPVKGRLAGSQAGGTPTSRRLLGAGGTPSSAARPGARTPLSPSASPSPRLSLPPWGGHLPGGSELLEVEAEAEEEEEVDEYNLVYVAATRARVGLFVNEAIATKLLQEPAVLPMHPRDLSRLQDSVAPALGSLTPSQLFWGGGLAGLPHESSVPANATAAAVPAAAAAATTAAAAAATTAAAAAATTAVAAAAAAASTAAASTAGAAVHPIVRITGASAAGAASAQPDAAAAVKVETVAIDSGVKGAGKLENGTGGGQTAPLLVQTAAALLQQQQQGVVLLTADNVGSTPLFCRRCRCQHVVPRERQWDVYLGRLALCDPCVRRTWLAHMLE